MVTDMSFKVIIVKSKHTNGAKPVCPKTMGSFCVSIFVSKISPPNLSKYLNEISTSKTFSFGCGLKVKYFFYILPDQWMFIYRWTDWNMNSNYYTCCTIYLWWSMPLLYQTWHSKKSTTWWISLLSISWACTIHHLIKPTHLLWVDSPNDAFIPYWLWNYLYYR